jgi:hypothetical protein
MENWMVVKIVFWWVNMRNGRAMEESANLHWKIIQSKRKFGKKIGN